jgi:hypothetical protein
MATIELSASVQSIVNPALDKLAGSANTCWATMRDAGLAEREDAAPYVKAWALLRNPLAEGQEFRGSAAQQAMYRALRAVWPSARGETQAARLKADKESVKVNRKTVNAIIEMLAGLDRAEFNATLQAVKAGVTFE